MYPSIRPYETQWVHVDTLKDGRKVKLYVEWSGNPKGIPVVYLHGGPGDHCTPHIRRLYSPEKYNIMMFDQRGCGKSLPMAHLEKNRTQELLKDMETLRILKGYDTWVVSGGSWGSSLALLYAQAHPERVRGLLLRGVYDLSQESCVDSVFPETYDEINRIIGYKKGNRYKQVLKVLKTRKSKRLAHLFIDSTPLYVKTRIPQKKENEYQGALISAHYEANHYFLPKRQIYNNMHKIRDIPTFMVNGRWDIVTPASIAYTLQKEMTQCELMFVDGGHTVNEPEVANALAACSDKLVKMI